MFARFFAITSQGEANKFVDDFGTIDLVKVMIMNYNNAVANANNLQRIESSPYFTGRLTEAQLEEERKKERKKVLISIARKMLSEGFTLDIISKLIDLDLDTLKTLKRE